jgi:hypothetical protein
MRETLKIEVDQNYDFFQRKLKSLLTDHKGQYVLLKNRTVVGYFSDPGAAYRAGLKKFPDKVFSVQEVTDEPVELGFMSLAFN